MHLEIVSLLYNFCPIIVVINMFVTLALAVAGVEEVEQIRISRSSKIIFVDYLLVLEKCKKGASHFSKKYFIFMHDADILHSCLSWDPYYGLNM